MVDTPKTAHPRTRRPPAARAPRTVLSEPAAKPAAAPGARPVPVVVRPAAKRHSWEIQVPVVQLRRVHLTMPHAGPVTLARPRAATALLAHGTRVAASVAFWPVTATIDAGIRVTRRAKRARSPGTR